MGVIETNGMSPRQQVPWNTCAVDAGEPRSPVERRGDEELPSLVPFFSLSTVCSPSWDAEAKASMGKGGENVF